MAAVRPLLILLLLLEQTSAMKLHAIRRPTTAMSSTTTGTLTVVFVHGLDSCCKTWEDTMDAVIEQQEGQNSVACVAVDQRGCGKSRLGHPAAFSQDALVQDLHETIQEYEKVVLVGHSLGGRIVLGYAAKYPDQVAACIVEDMDIAVRYPETSGLIQLNAEKLLPLGDFQQEYPSKEECIRALLDVGYPQSFVDKALASGRIEPLAEQTDNKTWYSHVNPDFRRLCYPHVLSTTQGKADCEQIVNHKIPIHLWIAGRDGTVCDESSIRQMQAILSYMLQVRRFPTAGHSIHSTNAPEYVEALRNVWKDMLLEKPKG